MKVADDMGDSDSSEAGRHNCKNVDHFDCCRVRSFGEKFKSEMTMSQNKIWSSGDLQDRDLLVLSLQQL